ncbi:MAG: hypothetical protein IPK50_07490 [Fibrobacterota bacterium]|nr:hypothetical protein [Fibrobacterota bacterium]QQS06735.1 MAG: hypothetical protein IPK50_07490 [Fibrobacterota bacterium]
MDPAAPRQVVIRSLLLSLLLTVAASARPWLVEGFVQSGTPLGEWNPRLSWSVHGLAQLDQMVAAGVGFGYEAVPGRPAGLIDARMQVRLPIGRQALPYLDVESGIGIRPVLEDSYLLWKLGGGLDLKLGDHSSLLAGGGLAAVGRMYGRLGLLLEL